MASKRRPCSRDQADRMVLLVALHSIRGKAFDPPRYLSLGTVRGQRSEKAQQPPTATILRRVSKPHTQELMDFVSVDGGHGQTRTREGRVVVRTGSGCRRSVRIFRSVTALPIGVLRAYGCDMSHKANRANLDGPRDTKKARHWRAGFDVRETKKRRVA